MSNQDNGCGGCLAILVGVGVFSWLVYHLIDTEMRLRYAESEVKALREVVSVVHDKDRARLVVNDLVVRKSLFLEEAMFEGITSRRGVGELDDETWTRLHGDFSNAEDLELMRRLPADLRLKLELQRMKKGL